MTTSGVYSYDQKFKDICTEAFERIGVEPTKISKVMMDSAARSANYSLIELGNRQVNLWTREQIVIPLEAGQNIYQLPSGTVDLPQDELSIISYNRITGGTPASSAGGTASFAFDGIFTTVCTQTSINGNISYDYGANNAQTINLLGIKTNPAATYTLSLEGSNDGSAWVEVLFVPATSYNPGETKWYPVRNPMSFQYYRVRESGGATLVVQEIYLATISDSNTLVLSTMSISEYMNLSAKTSTGTPTQYVVDKSVPFRIILWPTPNATGQLLFGSRLRQMQTVTDFRETVDVPYLSLEAFIGVLAHKLAVKYAPQKLEILLKLAEISVLAAEAENRERVPTSFIPNIGFYR